MSQDIDRKPKDDLVELLHKIQSNLVDDVDDSDDHISELKGILNETLGDLPFKFAILLVVFLNFLYTSYDAFFATGRITMTTIPNECYCDPVDRIFYRTVMMLSTIFWTLFLSTYIICSICGHKRRILVVCPRQHKLKTGDSYVCEVRDDLVKLIDVLGKKEKKFKTQLRELVSTKFLDDDHCESIRQHYYSTSLYWTKTNTDTSAHLFGTSHENDEQDDTQQSSSQGSSEPVQTVGARDTTANHNTSNVHTMQVDIEFVQDNTVESGLTANGQNNAVRAGEYRQANNGENAIMEDNNDMESGNGQNNSDSEQVEVISPAPDSSADPESDQVNNGQNNTGQLQAHSRQDIVNEEIEVISNANTSTTSDIELVNPLQGSNDPRQVTDQESRTCRRCSRQRCFTVLKISLIAIRFVFRLLIVPLLQLQLLNDYAWYCLLNDVIRNYCETETNMYYIGLDHSMVNYFVYILLLVALLFSFLINWFPKGIPQLVLLYKARRIMINKKGLNSLKSQLEYHAETCK